MRLLVPRRRRFASVNIYFAGSIRGGRQDQAIYAEILSLLQRHGTVSTEHVAAVDDPSRGDQLPSDAIFHRDMRWLAQADVVIAEVTTPSLGVGYELARAEVARKPVLCLYRLIEGRQLSAMVEGNVNFTTRHYESVDDVAAIVSGFLRERVTRDSRPEIRRRARALLDKLRGGFREANEGWQP